MSSFTASTPKNIIASEIAKAAIPASSPRIIANPSFSSRPNPSRNIPNAGAVFVPGMGSSMEQASRRISKPMSL